MIKHFPPELNKQSFHCPFCSILAFQSWSTEIYAKYHHVQANGSHVLENYILSEFHSAKCSFCSEISIWFKGKMVFPLSGNVELPNSDLPADVMIDYNEAKDIVNISPKGSAALLRLALQKLMGHIGEDGKVLNDDIKNLVERGLPEEIQKSLDIIRVTGNKAVHPGLIDFTDMPETAMALFKLINVICDYFITQPKKIAEVFENLPDKDKESIKKRDG